MDKQASLCNELVKMLSGPTLEKTSLHYENKPIQIYSRNSPPKTEKIQIKNSDNFQISDQNIDCGYSLELPRRSSSNKYPQSMY